MITTRTPVMSPPVDKGSPARRIVRDRAGRFWVVLPGEDAWAKREPFQPGADTDRESIPGHDLDMLGLPS